MNREQLIEKYRHLTLNTNDKGEWLICCFIYIDLLKGKRGAVRDAKIHLRSRAYDIRCGRLAA